MDWLFDPKIWIALVTLTALEIVLGVDNIIFISIITGKLPAAQQARARRIGLALAMLMRIGLLVSLSWVMGLTRPLFTAVGQEISGRDIILLTGGLFLLAKSTFEIHARLEGEEGQATAKGVSSFTGIVLQIVALDAVFSLDSVITAIGMVEEVPVMIAAVVIAVGVMLIFAGIISDFIHRHPTFKMLGLAFLLLIGVSLVAEGLDQHIPKGYIYSAMAFSALMEVLNLRTRHRAAKPVELREPYVEPGHHSA